MSVGDLMYAYTAGLPYTQVEQWKDTGYCFHSDHTLGYFFSYYYIGVPNGLLEPLKVPSDNLRTSHGFKRIESPEVDVWSGQGGECDHLRDKCTVDSRICHYVDPKQMDALFKEQQVPNQI